MNSILVSTCTPDSGAARSSRSSCILLLLFLTSAIGFHYFYHYYLVNHLQMKFLDLLTIGEGVLYSLTISIVFFWFINQLIQYVTLFFISSSYASSHHILSILIKSLAKIIKGIGFIIIFNCFCQNLSLPDDFSSIVNKISSILIIAGSGWILFQLILSCEKLLLHYYTNKTNNLLNSRKIITQLHILKRIALIIVGILVGGSILMLFDNVKALGVSVLTTAGIIGLVMTFTAQKALGGLFSGLELALTQPIKIGDSVIIENEFGIVEEINFRNVIIKLWDWRRLIVPTNYFLEHPFQNWSREESNNLIGTVYLYVDYTLPIAKLREELKKILSASTLWDGNVNTVQVSDLKDRVMQLRVLGSADSPAKTWDLRCEIREKLITFITEFYPQCLPVSRTKPCKES